VKSLSKMLRHKGFSLLEILVAFSIMAVAITIVLRIFSSGLTNAALTEEYCIGVQIAESLMASTGVVTSLQPGETSGSVGDKYDWLVVIKAVTQSSAGNQSGNDAPPNMFSVNVRVFWGDEGREQRSIELESLKFL